MTEEQEKYQENVGSEFAMCVCVCVCVCLWYLFRDCDVL